MNPDFRNTPDDEYARCPRCGGETPAENFNCIYCGEPLPRVGGVFTLLRYGGGRMLCAAIAIAVIVSLLAWLW